MKSILSILTLALSMSVSSLGHAMPDKGKALIYISPDEYEHPIKLWHFYYDYWFSQGKALEPVALETLKPGFTETGMCESNKAADVLIWLKPRMFYNPHMTRFYGNVVAHVYSGSGKHLATYQSKVERNGYLDILPATQVSTVYRMAMQDLLAQMRQDGELQKLVAEGLPQSETAMPCSMVTITPLTRQHQ